MKIILIIASILISNLTLAQHYNEQTAKEVLEERNSIKNGTYKKDTIRKDVVKLEKANPYINRLISKDSLNKIKCVIILGRRSSGLEQATKIKDNLISIGIKNVSLIMPSLSFNEVKKITKNSNILIYVGHGGLSNGMYLDSIDIIPKDFKSLELAKNHIILFKSVCFGAGSSATDTKDIGINEAKKRVIDYSKGFIDNGALLYYAINFNDKYDIFFNLLFRGESIETINTTIINELKRWNIKKEIDTIYNKYNIGITSNFSKKYKYKQYDFSYITTIGFNIKKLL
jgi:hypothetical protein